MPSPRCCRRSSTCDTLGGHPRFVRVSRSRAPELADDLSAFAISTAATPSAFVELIADQPVCGAAAGLPAAAARHLRPARHPAVFDEVICGFGRTGRAFGAETFGVVPDMTTMAKAWQRAQPGAAAVRDAVWQAIADKAPEGTIELFHGYTCSAHPWQPRRPWRRWKSMSGRRCSAPGGGAGALLPRQQVRAGGTAGGDRRARLWPAGCSSIGRWTAPGGELGFRCVEAALTRRAC